MDGDRLLGDMVPRLPPRNPYRKGNVREVWQAGEVHRRVDGHRQAEARRLHPGQRRGMGTIQRAEEVEGNPDFQGLQDRLAAHHVSRQSRGQGGLHHGSRRAHGEETGRDFRGEIRKTTVFRKKMRKNLEIPNKPLIFAPK